MTNSTTEILARINATLEARKAKNTPPTMSLDQAPAVVPGKEVIKLTPDQITSEVYVISPTQLTFIAETLGNLMADAMNMRSFAPKIRALADKSLRKALAAAKVKGKK